LGLHITKKLVEQHGGTIEMFSDGLGLGCVTVVELPLYINFTPTNSNCNPTIIESLVPTKKVSHQRLRKCLVVDDSLPNRKMLVRLLERAGHTCLSACNGQEAVEIMDADYAASMHDKDYDPIDSILMDFEMPVLNGPDATKILREKGYNTVTIIGVTGNVLVDDINYFTLAGANRVLPKPVTLSLIEDCWDSLMDQNDSGTVVNRV
jgi:two-component system, sensor histidine kinase